MEFTSDKLTKLHAMLAKEPNDAFLLYGLGMEFKKLNALDRAVEHFDRTIGVDPGYCYAYYQKGQTLEMLGREADARAAYEAGIVSARAKSDGHAEGEIRGALDMLG